MSDAVERASFSGGETILIRRNDGTEGAVLVRELPFAEVPTYARMLDALEPDLAVLFTGLPAGEISALARESVVDIVIKGEELNLPFTVAWLSRQNARQAKIAGALGLDVDQLRSHAQKSASGAGSPTSAPSPV